MSEDEFAKATGTVAMTLPGPRFVSADPEHARKVIEALGGTLEFEHGDEVSDWHVCAGPCNYYGRVVRMRAIFDPTDGTIREGLAPNAQIERELSANAVDTVLGLVGTGAWPSRKTIAYADAERVTLGNTRAELTAASDAVEAARKAFETADAIHLGTLTICTDTNGTTYTPADVAQALQAKSDALDELLRAAAAAGAGIIPTEPREGPDEAWQHAACLSIAEGRPGWRDVVDRSAAMQAVYDLRVAFERLRVPLVAAATEAGSVEVELTTSGTRPRT